jgi:NAD(P)-dependent dehydrogenase (short-subunit alcohol dehydrogenase family)
VTDVAEPIAHAHPLVNMGVDLSGKVALITGATRGLGREMAFAMARCGADIAVCSRKADACEATARAITQETGRRALPFPGNVSHWDALEPLANGVYDAFGRVDILVNNAGMSPLYPSLHEVTEALFDKVIGVNFKGPFRLSALIAARMVADGGGSIINISSNAGVTTGATIVPYGAAKAALNNMTMGFALAYGPTVRVNCVMSGPIRTDVAANWDMEAVGESVQAHALRRIGEPHEIIGAVLYFASNASSFTSGAVLAVTGGIP